MNKESSFRKNVLYPVLTAAILTTGIIGPTQTGFADTCPPIAAIFSSDPNSDEMVTYLAPGWRSNWSEIRDLQSIRFSEVYANAVGMQCTYDTSSGYITLFPTNNEKINTYSLMNEDRWRCNEQELSGFSPTTQIVCTCNDSLDECSFSPLL